MIVYWFYFAFLSILSISPIKLELNLSKILKFLLLFSLVIFIGLRYEVGGDWDIYEFDFKNNIEYFNFIEINYVRDFGYEFLSYLIFALGFEIYILNFLLAALFIYSLNKFINFVTDNHWLAFLISFPYIIIVVSMGFTRQGVAFSFVLLSLIAINDKKIIKYLILTFTGMLFHKSAALIIPFIFLTYFKLKFINLISFIALTFISTLIIYPEISRVAAGYFSENSKYISSGVYYRLFLNILAGFIFLIFYKFIKFNNNFDKLIIYIFIANLILIYFSLNYSTFVDRIIIYFTFIQTVVFSRIYLIYPKFKIIFNLTIILIYCLIFLIWLNYSNHSYAWLPYKNIIFQF